MEGYSVELKTHEVSAAQVRVQTGGGIYIGAGEQVVRRVVRLLKFCFIRFSVFLARFFSHRARESRVVDCTVRLADRDLSVCGGQSVAVSWTAGTVRTG